MASIFNKRIIGLLGGKKRCRDGGGVWEQGVDLEACGTGIEWYKGSRDGVKGLSQSIWHGREKA